MKLCRAELAFSLILMLGSLTFGYILGYPSPAVPDLQSEFNISTTESNLFNSISPLTAIVGPFASNFLMSHFGRRAAILATSLFGVAAWLLLLITTKKTFWVAILLRAFLGVVMGAYSSSTPLYIIELAPREMTGFFGTLHNLGIAIGLVLIYLAGNWLLWRTLAIIGAAICLTEFALLWIIPDSPVSKLGAKESIFQKKYARNLLIGMALMFLQQFSGINGILTRFGTLLSQAGVKSDSGIASAIAASAQVVSIFASGFFVDKIGRKIAWVISSSGVSASLVLYSLTLKFTWPPWVSILSIFCFLLFFGLGMGPISWYIVPELFPDEVRSAATSIVSSTNWLCSFVVVFSFPYIQELVGYFWCMLIFAIISAESAIFGAIEITNPERPIGAPVLDESLTKPVMD